MDAGGITWIAVIAGTVAAFHAGWLWYSSMLFGRAWAAGSKVELGSADQMPLLAMAAQVAALLLLALVIGVTATTDALFTAILAILAAAAFVVSQGAFIRKSGAAIAIDGGYIVLAGFIMIVCQGIF